MLRLRTLLVTAAVLVIMLTLPAMAQVTCTQSTDIDALSNCDALTLPAMAPVTCTPATCKFTLQVIKRDVRGCGWPDGDIGQIAVTLTAPDGASADSFVPSKIDFTVNAPGYPGKSGAFLQYKPSSRQPSYHWNSNIYRDRKVYFTPGDYLTGDTIDFRALLSAVVDAKINGKYTGKQIVELTGVQSDQPPNFSVVFANEIALHFIGGPGCDCNPPEIPWVHKCHKRMPGNERQPQDE